jgi:serine/threonine protein kinase
VDKIGRYQLLKKVGQGAMGVVYKAMDPSIERVVAVKTMSADLDTDPELRARFFREARSAGQLSHKNIVTIYDLGEEAGKAYMAMEFLDGEDVKQMITRGARVSIESRLEYMIEVLEGLSHAHQKGIFHRDIKPGNLYITKSGQVKILDFGLARMASSDVTKTGLLMGTPNYMSPEQINGAIIDQRSDIFSAGATFYEMLTGRKPFFSSSLQSTFFKILQQDPEPLEKVDPTIPPEFSPVLLKAMAKDPAARYQSAEEMAEVLERFPKMLEQRRRKARLEARKAFEKLDSFVTENAELLGGPSPECIDLREVLLVSGRTVDDTARNQNVELGLLEVLEIRDRATRENQRLEVLLHRRQEAATLLLLASSAELEGQFDKALELVEKVAPDVPEADEADAFSKRIRKIISERERVQALDAISHLERLISENQGYLASENRLNPADLKSAMDEPVTRNTADMDATALVAPSKSDSELIRIRDRANAEYARLLEVIAKQRESRQRRIAQLLQESQQLHAQKMFPESLNRLAELLAQDPENLEAQALRRRVTTDFEDERRRQEQSKKAAALLQTASAQYSAQNLEGAHKSLVDALALNPNYPEAVSLLDDVERAQELARLEERRRKAEFAATQAREALLEGNLSQARQEVERALGFDPDGAIARGALRDLIHVEESIKTLLQEGLSLLQAGDETKAAAKAEAILKLDRQSVPGNDLEKKIAERRETREREDREKKERIARALTQALDAETKQQLGRARELATSVLKEESAHAEATALLKRIEETEAREALERRARELLSSAERLAKYDDFQGAVSLIQKAGVAVTSLEFVKQSLDKYQQARSQQEARDQAERERRERIVSALSEARKAQSAGQLEKALALVRRIITEDPGHKEAREFLKAVEDAIETLRQREETEKRARELLSQAEVLASQGNYREALSSLQESEPRVISLAPVKQRLEEYQKLAKAQEEAIEHARRVQNHLESGRKLLSQADFAGCEREMDQVLGLEPGHPGALEARAQARAQLQKQRAEQERKRQLADAIRSIEQNLKAGHLEAARQGVSRAQAIETDNPEVARLQAQITQREAELREQQLKKQRLQKLLADAKSALENQDPDQADSLLTEAVTLGAGRSETAALKKRIDKLRRSMQRPAKGPIPLALFSAIGLAVLAVIGLSIWTMRPAEYQQQITSAQTYLQQNEFGKAIETLQQVPSDSRLYGQAQNLLKQAHAGQKKKDIDSLTVEASSLRRAGQNDKSLATIDKLLELDPSNQTAKSIRDDIKAESYVNATKAEQDRIVSEALAKAEELFNAGNLEAAKEKADEVTRNRPDDPGATRLKRTITRLLDASDKANGERAKMEQAKGKAIAAKAPEMAAASFTTAQRMEQSAVRQQTAREFDQAARTFSDATRLYAESEVYAADSVARQRTQQQQRSQAENARGEYDKNHTKARDAGAEAKGVAAYRDGMKSASDAQTKLDRGDFNGARGDFETASQKMQQAMLDAAQPAPAPPAAAPPTPAPTAPTNTAAINAPAQAQKLDAQRAEDERAIRNVLERYRVAYEAKSVQDLRSIFPAFRGTREEKAFTEEMKHAKTVQLQLPVTGIQISADTATVMAQWQLTIVFTDSPKQSSPQTAGAQFKLRKANGVWSIQNIDR